MRKALRIKTEKILNEHRFNRRWGKTLTALSLVVALGMSHALILPAVTLEDKTYCGYEQHVEHAEECYTEDKTLTCELSEEGHKHDDNCYEEQTHLTCVLEENEGHMHSEGCLDESGEQICGLGDGEGAHHHSESCYTTESVLICNLDESEPHVHGEECYSIEKALTCTRPLHEHTLQCYSNPEADVESQSIWGRTIIGVELTGHWDEDVLAIAKTQIGYTESLKNYLVEEDGTTKNGYTRYGEWYGSPYGEWCAMFCSFCLNYAQVDRNMMPVSAGCSSWIEILSASKLYHTSTADYEAKPGDLIFFDYDGDGEADHVGFVYEINESTIRTIEGNKADQVKYDSYSVGDACIMGYGELPENPNLQEKSEPVEEELVREAADDETDADEKTITATAEDGATVTVTGELPEDAEVTIVPVVLTEDEVVAYLGKGGAVSVQSYVVYDITIWSDGAEWQPDDTVSVKITKPDIEIEDGKRFAVSHVNDAGQAFDVKAEMAEDGSIEISTDGFSLYIIYTYTVDFHYGDLTFSIQGASSIQLSELFDALNIDLALSDVESVRFSNDSLIRIERITNAANELDWKLISLNPFDTMEELTITLKDGQIITIHVTDANEGSNPLTPTQSPDYIGTYPTGSGSNDWQITAQQYAGRSQSQKIPVDSDGDGKTDVYLQKNVVPTAKENEFLVYLSVDKQTTWEEFLNDSRVALTTSNSYKNDRPGTVYQSIHGNVTAELAEHGNQGTYSNQYYIRFNVWQNHSSAQPLYSYYDWRYGNTSNCSNASAFLRVPGLGYICVAQEVNLHVAGNGQSNPFVLDIYLSDGLQSNLTFYNTEFTEVADALGDNIEFLEILNSDGAASYDPGTHAITWTPEDWQTVVPEFNYPPLSAWMENVVQMVYKVRLNVKSDGFTSCADTIDDKAASIAAGESNPVNTSAVLTFDKIPLPLTNGIPEVRGLEAEFPVPEVRGLMYDVSIVKQNEDGEALAGAVFGLYESDRTTPVTVDDEPLTFTTEADGIGRLTGLPFGDYVIKEIEAPAGYYLASPNWWRVHMCFTDAEADLTPDDAPYEQNMRFTGNDVGGQWIVTNPKDPINIPEIETPEPPEPYVPDLDPTLYKQIDYLGDNEGETFNNPDTALDDAGIAGLDDLYRLYLNMQGDSQGVDLVLVLDASDSMFTNNMGDIRRVDVLENFLNGTNGNPGFVEAFLNANIENQLSVVTFGYTAEMLLDWTQEPTEIHVPQSGWTNYTSGLYVADELLHKPAALESDNQKLVIFLGDGSVTAAYHDGLLHNDMDDKYICQQANVTNAGSFLYSVLRDIKNGTLTNQDIYRSSYGGETLYYIVELGSRPSSRAVARLVRDLQMDIPGFTNGVGITDAAAFEAFYNTYFFRNSRPADWYQGALSIINAPLPTRTLDLYKMTDHAFLQFMALNPGVVVHTIGFSTEIEKEETDILNAPRKQSEVLRFMARYGQGQYQYADDAQSLADAIYSICFMVDAGMTDTLSDYVAVYADNPELKVVQTDLNGENEVVLYENDALTEEGEEILESVTLGSDGKLKVKFKPDYIVSASQIYTASFNVQLTPEIYTQFLSGGNSYPDVGDMGTDYGLNDTSGGQEGFLSNTEAKVTWTAGGAPDEKGFPHPVVQVPESRLYELPHTGGSGILLYTFGGISLMLSATSYGIIRRKRKCRRG